MTATPKSTPHVVSRREGISRAEPLTLKVRPMLCGKKRVSAPQGARRGKGPSTHTRIVEITSGRTVYQQGLAATCKDSPVEAKAVVGERYSALRMSQYERRRRGNSRPGGADTAPDEVTPPTGKGALGKWRARRRNIGWSQNQSTDDNTDACRAERITVQPRGVCRRVLKPRVVREGRSGRAAAANRTREIRPSGMRGGLSET